MDLEVIKKAMSSNPGIRKLFKDMGTSADEAVSSHADFVLSELFTDEEIANALHKAIFTLTTVVGQAEYEITGEENSSGDSLDNAMRVLSVTPSVTSSNSTPQPLRLFTTREEWLERRYREGIRLADTSGPVGYIPVRIESTNGRNNPVIELVPGVSEALNYDVEYIKDWKATHPEWDNISNIWADHIMNAFLSKLFPENGTFVGRWEKSKKNMRSHIHPTDDTPDKWYAPEMEERNRWRNLRRFRY